MSNKYDSLAVAVSLKRKVIQTGDYDNKRWLDHDSEITLKLKQHTSRNAEFIVNGNSSHTIWYSQLAAIFLTLDDFVPCGAEIIKKDGSHIGICQMSVDEFISFVKGKTFKVSVNPTGDVAKFDCKNLPSGITYREVSRIIADLSNAKKFEEAAHYLLPAKAYDLYEV